MVRWARGSGIAAPRVEEEVLGVFCPRCGNAVGGGDAFCKSCGAHLGTPGPSATGPGPAPDGGGNRRRALWIALIAVLSVTIIAVAAVAAVLVTSPEETTDGTTASSLAPTATSPVAVTTTTRPPEGSTSTTAASSVPVAPGMAGGEWAETEIPQPPGPVYAVAVSDEVIVMDAEAGMYAHVFGEDVLTSLPLDMSGYAAPDVDGRLAVWWEWEYDQGSGGYLDEAVFAMRVPDGQKVRVTGEGRSVAYPQAAAGLITWTEPRPSEDAPDELYEQPIFGVGVDPAGRPDQEPQLLVDTASAYVLGDAVWIYSLSDRYLAWEDHHTGDGGVVGSRVADLEGAGDVDLGAESWRPSVGGDVVAYFSGNGLQAMDLAGSRQWTVDPAGDWPSAAPTFVAYFRPASPRGDAGYEIVARGLGDGGVEQVLGTQETPPYLSTAIGVASSRVAFVTDSGSVRVFEWRSP